MQDVLKQIVDHKKQEIAVTKELVPAGQLEKQLSELKPTRPFAESLRNASTGIGLIAEVKKASPSAGLIRENFDPVEIAEIYSQNGAACISVLTDEHFFQGHLDYLRQTRLSVETPLLRKDFILDRYQVLEARAAGADAVLLIAECLDDESLADLYEYTRELDMEALIELYEEENLERVLQLQPQMIGINNRDLRTFVTNLDHCVKLSQKIPEGVLVVGESGIVSRADVHTLQEAGIGAILVGETLMRSDDIALAIRGLLDLDELEDWN